MSVAFVTYNHANFVEEALRSAAEQDYENLEIVVADDGSQDGTRALAAEVSRQYPDRVMILPDQGHIGVVANYNRALAACRGKYIAFLDGDDVFLPGKISRQVEWLEEDDRRVLCGHDVEAFDSTTGGRLYLWSNRFGLPSGEGAAPVIKFGVPYCGVSIMVRKAALPLGGYDARLRMIVDWKLWIDCLTGDGRFGCVGGVLAKYRRHVTNATTRFSEVGQDDRFVTLALVESRHRELGGACAYGRAMAHYGLGIQALQRGEERLARRHFINALRSRVLWKPLRALPLTFLGRGSRWLLSRRVE